MSILFLNVGCNTVKILKVNSEDDFSLTNYKTSDFHNVDVEIKPYTAHENGTGAYQPENGVDPP